MMALKALNEKFGLKESAVKGLGLSGCLNHICCIFSAS